LRRITAGGIVLEGELRLSGGFLTASAAWAEALHGPILRARVAAARAPAGFLAQHSRSFRFAAGFFHRDDAARVAGVYAYCRVTDDLVDRPPPGVDGEALLASWAELSHQAHRGEATGLPLLDATLGEMGRRGIPFALAAELCEGMRMDLRGVRYSSLEALRAYSYRVASVVGLWLARLFGVQDPMLLERAERLGHAMQLTNVLRDVGEDWERGRLYLPADRLAAHRIGTAELERMRRGSLPIQPGFRALMEELMAVADEDYRSALAVLPELPASFARPVWVAAHVYRGIHAEIRRNRFDTLTRRAHTGPTAKGLLAARALWQLHRARGGEATSR
jgi:15-cis-phytoene synthase